MSVITDFSDWNKFQRNIMSMLWFWSYEFSNSIHRSTANFRKHFRQHLSTYFGEKIKIWKFDFKPPIKLHLSLWSHENVQKDNFMNARFSQKLLHMITLHIWFMCAVSMARAHFVRTNIENFIITNLNACKLVFS